MTLIVAGHETTASTLNWTWYLLSQNPDAEAKLSDELRRLPPHGVPTVEDLPKYIYARNVVEEAMRLYPPGWLLTRRAIKDDHLGEYYLTAGTEIYIHPSPSNGILTYGKLPIASSQIDSMPTFRQIGRPGCNDAVFDQAPETALANTWPGWKCEVD